MELTKLYPPLLEAEIPAFTTTIKIPFLHNNLVGFNDFIGFQVLIKELNGKVIYNASVNWNKETNELCLTFLTPFPNTENVNWYKFSIAYISANGTIGYFSSAAVGKYLGNTTDENFTVKLENNASDGEDTYTGVYIHLNDSSEKEFSYQFILEDGYGNVKVDTGVILHNIQSKDDTVDTSYDKFICNYRLEPLVNDLGIILKYKLTYKVVTINGYELSTFAFIKPNYEPRTNVPFVIDTELNRESGSVKVYLRANPQFSSGSRYIVGSFVLKRLCNKDNYFRYFVIKKMSVTNRDLLELPSNFLLYEDYTVESGCNYIYVLQQLNKEGRTFNGVKSYMYNDYISVSFDDMFLFDGERQLNIKYNPKVASFKTNILGTKIETIGNQFPTILYNGKTSYKEFSLSGLISYTMDKGYDFIRGLAPALLMMRLETNHSSSHIREYRNGLIYDDRDTPRNDKLNDMSNLNNNYEFWNDSNNLIDPTDMNIKVERDFKLAVLDFLNNKKPKLFRSATEGNYCITTMNSSLTPIDTLGRMLHSFNSTAYEIMDINDFTDTLIKETAGSNPGFFGDNALNFYTKVVNITPDIYDKNLLRESLYVKRLLIVDAEPMSKVYCYLRRLPTFSTRRKRIITIGATGFYQYDCFNDDEYIAEIYVSSKDGPTTGSLIIQDGIEINDSLFDNTYYETTTNVIIEKEITCKYRLRRSLMVKLINPFYEVTNNEAYGRANRLDKIYHIKARNFDKFSACEATIEIGLCQSLRDELDAIGMRDLDAREIYMSLTMENFIHNTNLYSTYFTNSRSASNPIERYTSIEAEMYDSMIGSEFYILYKEHLNGNYTLSDFIEAANSILDEMQPSERLTFILLPQEEKDIVIDLNLPLEDIVYNNCIFYFSEDNPYDPITKLSNLRYNITAKMTEFTCYEGELVGER